MAPGFKVVVATVLACMALSEVCARTCITHDTRPLRNIQCGGGPNGDADRLYARDIGGASPFAVAWLMDAGG